MAKFNVDDSTIITGTISMILQSASYPEAAKGIAVAMIAFKAVAIYVQQKHAHFNIERLSVYTIVIIIRVLHGKIHSCCVLYLGKLINR